MEAVAPHPGMSDEEEVFVASQWQLMWWRFRKHRVAIVAVFVLLLFYLVSFVAEFLGTGDPAALSHKFSYLQPQPIRWFDDGVFMPHVNGIKGFRNPESYEKYYEMEPDVKIPVGFFVEGFEYTFLGMRLDRHLLGFSDPEQYEERPGPFLLGSDRLGRDQWSRLTIATRISLSIGLVGVAIAMVKGILLGGISGYYGGWVDQIIQRAIEFLNSIPTIPLWMALAAAIPLDWGLLKVYFAITLILSLFFSTSLARVVRGKFLSLREEDFVMAARLSGASEMRIMFRHMVPAFSSHIIAAATLAIPGMIISETGLSYLGLGLRPPAVSWGVMLQQAQNAQTVALYPWLMVVALPVIVAILAFNFMGDGVRDAADPYSQ